MSKNICRAAALAALSTLFGDVAVAAAGTEQYRYDALGRLNRVIYPDGRVILYTYDAAGNRKTSGPTTVPTQPPAPPPPPPPPPPAQPGTIVLAGAAYPNGCSGCIGSFWIDITNSGAGPLNNVSFSLANVGVAGCSPSGSGVSTIAPGVTVRFTWSKASFASVNCGPRVTATNATNSPSIWSNL